jgi:hypothetical protein
MSAARGAGLVDVIGYAPAAPLYLAAGWVAPLPLPPAQKGPPPSGWTGHGAPYPDWRQLRAFIESNPLANLALRLPDDVIGLDVDAYDGRFGGRTIAAATQRWGELPPTFISSARSDGMSGIRLYGVPSGLVWPSALHLAMAIAGPGHVEIVQAGHRYVCAWPSIHPLGTRVHWHDGSWRQLSGPPRHVEVPPLPYGWVEGLQAAERREASPASGRRRAPRSRRSAYGSIDGLVRRVRNADVGERNDVLFWAACRLEERASGDVERGRARLAAAARDAGLPDTEIKTAMDQAASQIAGTGPAGGAS